MFPKRTGDGVTVGVVDEQSYENMSEILMKKHHVGYLDIFGGGGNNIKWILKNGVRASIGFSWLR
jgi:hypothetical protein